MKKRRKKEEKELTYPDQMSCIHLKCRHIITKEFSLEKFKNCECFYYNDFFKTRRSMWGDRVYGVNQFSFNWTRPWAVYRLNIDRHQADRCLMDGHT